LKISKFFYFKILNSTIKKTSAASLNHSCFPNCAIIFNGVKLYVQTIREFAKDEEVTSSTYRFLSCWILIISILKPTISYTELLLERNERKRFLQDNYYFNC